MYSVGALLKEAMHSLQACSDSPRLDAEVLLGHVLGCNRSRLHAWPEHEVPAEAELQFHALLGRRREGMPVAYLTGQQEFWSLNLAINSHALVPRPDTELLVSLALAQIPTEAAWHIADLGTGSGAIALAIARERPGCRIVATDISHEALALARRNADDLGLESVEFRHGSWLQPLAASRFDLIISNPPYIAADDPHLEAAGVRHEPRQALVPGPAGTEALEIIIRDARAHLRPGGWLFLEHGYDQADAVAGLLATHGYQELIDHHDLAGQPRVAAACWPGATGRDRQ